MLFNHCPTSTTSLKRIVGSPKPQKIISATLDQSYLENNSFTNSTEGSSLSHKLLCSLNSFKLLKQNVQEQEHLFVMLI